MEADTRPTPPEKPLPGDCCDTGCEVCVFDAYSEALAEYQKALADWQRLNGPDSPDKTCV